MSLYIQHNKKLAFIISLAVLMFAGLFVALLLGSVSLPASSLYAIINPSSNETVENSVRLIIGEIRLPRALLAMLIGAALAACGTVTQGLFRNPLADPSLIGVSAGASIGATLVIAVGGSWFGFDYFAGSFWGLSSVSLGAFVCALATVMLVYLLSTSHNGTSVATMLLAGIAITALAGGFTSLLEYMSDNEALRRISLWRMGGLDGATFVHVWIMFLVVVVLGAGFLRYRLALNALLLGESEARHLGVDVQKIKIYLIILVAIGVGVSVSIAGGIGFIGLIVPHIMRLVIGPDHRYLLPASLVAGALLLLLADTVARTVIAPVEIPVGIITALIGAPFFMSLLRKRHQYGMQGG